VLSACQSGLSDRLGGDEIAGLAQAFFFAGARTLVVSLWEVNDPATAALMGALYRRLETGVDIASALRLAMDDVKSEPRWVDPHFWGGFVVQGDPLVGLP